MSCRAPPIYGRNARSECSLQSSPAPGNDNKRLPVRSLKHYCVLFVARAAGAFMHPPLHHTVMHWWVEPDRLEPSNPYQLPPKGASTYNAVPLPTRANHKNTITGAEELPARARTGRHQCTSEQSLFFAAATRTKVLGNNGSPGYEPTGTPSRGARGNNPPPGPAN